MKKIVPLVWFIFVYISCSTATSGFKAPGLVQGRVIPIKIIRPGVIATLHVREGQTVQSGETIAQLDKTVLESAFRKLDIARKEIVNARNRARQKMELVKSSLETYQEQVASLQRLKKEKAVSGIELEKARLGLVEAKSALLDLENGLAALTIREEKLNAELESTRFIESQMILTSPVNGTILDVFVSAGETVLPGSIIAHVLDNSSLYIEVFIEETEMSQLKLNDGVIIRVDGRSDPLSGTIRYFGSRAEFSPKYIISEKERKALLYEVRISLDHADPFIKLGMPLTVEFAGDYSAGRE